MTTSYPFSCILLSGMPCTGKDTLSSQLIGRDSTFALFRKHRAVPVALLHEQEHAYINVIPETFQALAESGEFIQFHSRYGKMYGVSKVEYAEFIQMQKIPIIHVGKYENLAILRQGGLPEGLSVLLWTDRNTIQLRLLERHQHRTDGIEERLMAYDQEVAQLSAAASEGNLDFQLIFENNGADPKAASEELLALLRTPAARSTEATQAKLAQILQENRSR